MFRFWVLRPLIHFAPIQQSCPLYTRNLDLGRVSRQVSPASPRQKYTGLPHTETVFKLLLVRKFDQITVLKYCYSNGPNGESDLSAAAGIYDLTNNFNSPSVGSRQDERQRRANQFRLPPHRAFEAHTQESLSFATHIISSKRWNSCSSRQQQTWTCQ